MLPEENQIISDFKLIKKEYIAEIDSTVLHFEHQKTKAQLVAIKNSDTNKHFCITFKTPPKDSTGVAHILEHCVLAGSIKYPLKGVMYEFYKGNLATILTAGTSADKTYYQIASRNLKEYYDIMDVYLDLTLNPLLKEETFLEEGWHYELLTDQDYVSYKGVVFNEMKGALSKPLYQLEREAWGTLYSGTTYENIAGGIPKVITKLTYEQLKQFHADYYHPSNAIIYLYGDAPLKDELKLINDNFLSKFDYKNPCSSIKHQNNIAEFTTKTITYNATSGEDLKNKTYFALCTNICTADNLEIVLAMDILADLLFNSEYSTLKQEIMASGIARDISGWVNNLYFVHLLVLLTGSDADKQEHFTTIYQNVLQKIVANGLDKEHISTVINKLKFKNSETSIDVRRSQNFMYFITNALCYGADIFSSLKVNELIANVREKALNSRYLEEIIEKFLLNNQRIALVKMIPDPEKAHREEAEEKASLAAFEKSLTPTARAALIVKSNRLLTLQKQEESLESIQKLPKLSLSDLKLKADLQEPTVLHIGETTILVNELFTNDIIYLSVGWRLDKIPLDIVPFLDIFRCLLSKIGTKNRIYTQLNCELQNYLGGLETKMQIHSHFDNSDNYQPIMWIETKAFCHNIDKMLEILTDICTNLDLDNQDRIQEVILRNFASKEREIQAEGFSYSINRIKSYLSDEGKYTDSLNGMRAYQNLKKIAENFSHEKENLLDKLHKIKGILFNRKNLIINITSDQQCIEQFMQKSTHFIGNFDNSHFESAEIRFPSVVKNEAFLTQAQIVFAAQGANIYQSGVNYSGALNVLLRFFLRDYFHNIVKIQGGAYDCIIRFNECTGDMIFCSYRDPNIKETYEAFDGISKAVAKLDLSEEQLNNLKIGAYAALNPLQNAYNKGITARNNYLSGLTPEHFNKTIAEILDTTIEDLRAMVPALEKFTQSAYRCVIGNRSKIEANKDLFNELIQV